MIKQGFHWRLLVLGPLGLLLSRSWISFSLTACLAAAIVRFAPVPMLPCLALLNGTLALFGGELIAWESRLQGNRACGVWLGRSAAEAMLRASDRAGGKQA
ncbi:hypothetical protein [Swaminathania salitolerans]|nr:hypothetical protein [Swaminathania salitolerans]